MYFAKNALLSFAFATSLAVAAPGSSPVAAELETRAPIPNFKVGWGQELQNRT